MTMEKKNQASAVCLLSPVLDLLHKLLLSLKVRKLFLPQKIAHPTPPLRLVSTSDRVIN